LGTCGGFAGKIERGEVILVNRTVIYDIVEQMGDQSAAIQRFAAQLDLSWLRKPYPGLVRTDVMVSADRDILADDIPMLVDTYGAAAGDWESGAIAWVSAQRGLRCLILRGVSDLVGAEGGEAYGNVDLFTERAGGIVWALLDQLPGWLDCVTDSV
jgi:adenosylhomocysteine nucleosidase